MLTERRKQIKCEVVNNLQTKTIKFMKESEKIAKEAGYKKMAVISGVGVRKYYEKLGYELDRTYMVKSLL